MYFMDALAQWASHAGGADLIGRCVFILHWDPQAAAPVYKKAVIKEYIEDLGLHLVVYEGVSAGSTISCRYGSKMFHLWCVPKHALSDEALSCVGVMNRCPVWLDSMVKCCNLNQTQLLQVAHTPQPLILHWTTKD